MNITLTNKDHASFVLTMAPEPEAAPIIGAIRSSISREVQFSIAEIPGISGGSSSRIRFDFVVEELAAGEELVFSTGPFLEKVARWHGVPAKEAELTISTWGL